MIDAGLRGGRQVAGPADPRLPRARPTPRSSTRRPGLESGMTALVGALAGIDMISGRRDAGLPAGPEPGEARHRRRDDRDGPAAAPRHRDADRDARDRLLRGGRAGGPVPGAARTRAGCSASEQFLPSKVIDRNSRRAWLDAGGLDAFGRAQDAGGGAAGGAHAVPALDPAVAAALAARVREAGAPFGLGDALPGVPAGLAGVRSPPSGGCRPGPAAAAGARAGATGPNLPRRLEAAHGWTTPPPAPGARPHRHGRRPVRGCGALTRRAA